MNFVRVKLQGESNLRLAFGLNIDRIEDYGTEFSLSLL
jgi:hypothetical protein